MKVVSRIGVTMLGLAILAAPLNVSLSAQEESTEESPSEDSPRIQFEGNFFGLDMGADKSSLDIARNIKGTLYLLGNVPELRVGFIHYEARVHAATGVCMVAAITDPFDTAGDGEALRARFYALKPALDAELGEARVIDRVIPGNSDMYRDHFTTFLRQQKAVLAARWSFNNGHLLGRQVSEVLLIAQPVTRLTVALILQVKYNNYFECTRAEARDIAAAAREN